MMLAPIIRCFESTGASELIAVVVFALTGRTTATYVHDLLEA